MRPFSFLNWLQGGEPTAVLTVRLYSARVDPITNPVIADFTEATFPGYQRFPFPPASSATQLSSTAAALVVANTVFSVGPSPLPGESIAGSFCVALRADGSQVVFAWQDLATPTPMQKLGDQIGLTVNVTCEAFSIPA
jgi:hypothetical protein